MEYYNTQVIGAINIRLLETTRPHRRRHPPPLTAHSLHMVELRTSTRHRPPSRNEPTSTEASIESPLDHLAELGIIENRRTPGNTSECAIHLDASSTTAASRQRALPATTASPTARTYKPPPSWKPRSPKMTSPRWPS